ncbi:MAG: helix-turn-helix domain-containing protein [Propionicimonas sp.]
MSTGQLDARARAYAALGDPSRLAIVDLLARTDLSSGELGARLDLPTNLMAHHLQVLELAGLITRRRSEGDGRRSYVRLTRACHDLIGQPPAPRPHRLAFVCSQNSARSQLAEAYWRTVSDVPAVSGGTHPASGVNPQAVATGRRHGLDLSMARPKLACEVLAGDELVVAVCDRAYEELGTSPLHWSVPDPAGAEGPDAFEHAYDDLTDRITRLAASFSVPA